MFQYSEQFQEQLGVCTPPPIRPTALVDPSVHRHIGRPRTARVTSAIEGTPTRGGGGRRGRHRLALAGVIHDQPSGELVPLHQSEPVETPSRNRPTRRRRCGQCGNEGHDRRTCYDNAVARQKAAALKAKDARRMRETGGS